MLARVSGSAGEYFSLGAQARHQRVDRVAARLDAGHAGRRDGAHVPVVRAACMTAQELAAALKLARGHPARHAARCRHCLDAPGGSGTSVSCVSPVPQNPHKSGSAARFPTESPRTKRHSPAHGGTAANMALVALTGLYAGSAGLAMLKLCVARSGTDLLLSGRSKVRILLGALLGALGFCRLDTSACHSRARWIRPLTPPGPGELGACGVANGVGLLGLALMLARKL